MTQAPQRPQRDPAASMSLLTELMTNPQDPAYQWEADRRAAAGQPDSESLRSPWLFVVAFLVGLALAVSALTLRQPAGQAQKDRDNLISRIHKEQSDIDSANRRIDSLQTDISARQAAALRHGHDTSAADQISRLGLLAGEVAAKGPGLVLTLDNAPTGQTDLNGTDPRAATNLQGTLTSTDLQQIVNGLWTAGAEAISINDQRLTALSAIRFAGQAILVNFRPLAPPYVISAIGPPTMKATFNAGSGGVYLRGLVDGFGIQASTATKSSVQVPALGLVQLHYAQQLKETK